LVRQLVAEGCHNATAWRKLSKRARRQDCHRGGIRGGEEQGRAASSVWSKPRDAIVDVHIECRRRGRDGFLQPFMLSGERPGSQIGRFPGELAGAIWFCARGLRLAKVGVEGSNPFARSNI
jgi:hypothetical protein